MLKLTGMHEPISKVENINWFCRSEIESIITTIHSRLLAHAVPTVSPFCMADKIIRNMKLQTLLLPYTHVIRSKVE